MVDKPKCITFDCYGTLVQWHRALHDGVSAVLSQHAGASDIEVDETVDALRTLSMEEQQRPPYRDYKTVLRSSLEDVLARRGLSPRPGDGEILLSFLRDIPPHPDVPATLDRLRQQFRLAIISNSDDDLTGPLRRSAFPSTSWSPPSRQGPTSRITFCSGTRMPISA